MNDAAPIPLAEARVAEARRQLGETLDALQARLHPRAVARDAMDELAEGGEKALRSGADVVRRNPVKVAGAVAIVAAIAGRHRIGALIARLRRPKDEAPQPAPARRVRFARPRPAPTRRDET